MRSAISRLGISGISIGVVAGDEGGCVQVGVEANAGLRDIVEHDGVCAFGEELLAGAADAGVHLGGEGDDERAGLMRFGD